MIFRYSDKLDDAQVKELTSRLENRKIIDVDYVIEGNDNYFTLKFDDETKLTIYYESGKGSLVVGEGFP